MKYSDNWTNKRRNFIPKDKIVEYVTVTGVCEATARLLLAYGNLTEITYR